MLVRFLFSLSLIEERIDRSLSLQDSRSLKETTMAEGQPLSNINYSLQDYSTSIEYFDKVDQQMSSIYRRFSSSCSFSD